jgi:hypothetical protein
MTICFYLSFIQWKLQCWNILACEIFDYRQKLRRLEVAVMEYRESLEERGIKNAEEIERKVSAHRRKLKAEFGLMDETADNDKHHTRITGKLQGDIVSCFLC